MISCRHRRVKSKTKDEVMAWGARDEYAKVNLTSLQMDIRH